MASRQNPSRAARNTGPSSSQSSRSLLPKRRLRLNTSPSPSPSPPRRTQPRPTRQVPPPAPQSRPHNQEAARFENDKAQEHHQAIQRFRFVKERQLANDFRDFAEVHLQLRTRGWLMFNNLLGDGNETLAREFYANAHRWKASLPYSHSCIVRGVRVAYSAASLSRFLGLPDVDHCVVQERRGQWNASNTEAQDEMKDRQCLPGTVWHTGIAHKRRVRLTRLNPEARAWAEFFVCNVEPSGNSSEVTINELTLIDAVCNGEKVDLALLLRDSIQKIADRKDSRATLGHCSLLTRLMLDCGVPTVPTDAVLKPKGAVTMKWIERVVNSEARVEDQINFEDLDMEIDGFQGGDFNFGMEPPPMGQQDMGDLPNPTHTQEGEPNQHSVNEIAALLTQMDIATSLRLPHNYYDQNSALYREAMAYREQYYPRPFYPLYPTMEAMQSRWTTQETELRAAQMRERDAWMTQHSEWANMQQGLFHDSPHHGGSSHAGPSMPHPNDHGNDAQQ
ncbi:hypothetical protein QL285_064074 [Trifolium repens]|nr:hypothetical protein QL285_064074 [Trifolium repens]